MEWIRELGEFLWAVVNNWAAWTTGGVVVALLWLWSTLRQIPISRKIGVIIALLFLFLSFFNAWREQKHIAEQAVKELEASTKPNFDFWLDQAVLKLQGSNTLFIPHATIINKGADSVAIGYHAHYKSESLDVDVNVVSPLSDAELSGPTGESIKLQRANFLTSKTDAIPRGHELSGRILLVIPGNRIEEIKTGKAAITVYVKDYLARQYSAEYRSTGTNEHMQFGPEETGNSNKY